MRSDERGFTLIELLVACAIIGILASITVPSYVARRVSANETAIVATLRAVSQAQFQFRSQNAVDTNRDAVSEYGSLGELSSVEPLRGQTAPLTQRLLSASLGNLDPNGHAVLHGYRIAMYLPDATGVGVVATMANRGLFDPARATTYYTCVAWPLSVNVTGSRTFFVNQQGQMLKTVLPHYSGLGPMPPAGCALVGTPDPASIESQGLAINATGADGRSWTTVN